ncbi:MAG: hypothetical protein P4M11_13055 [Candidatus Pacebacteria bacterium]|nr:hypothetical protein [Candidatus Paceibacterota bacterium]
MGTILWLAILFFGILLFPWLLVLLLRILLKRYRFQIWPVGFLCYSHGRMVIPCTQCITLVLTFRHLSISLNWSRPFVTFRLRGFKAHFVQYNILKDPNINQYANDLKTQFLMEMKKKFSTGSVPIVVESPAPSTNKLSQSLFDRIEGIIEEADVQFVDVRNDQEKREAIAKFYGQIDRAPDKVFGDFNGYLPVASVVASYGDGNFSLAAQVPLVTVRYRLSRHVSTVHDVSVPFRFSE